MITCILHNYNWLLEDAHQIFYSRFQCYRYFDKHKTHTYFNVCLHTIAGARLKSLNNGIYELSINVISFCNLQR